jgi:hypothetical protein
MSIQSALRKLKPGHSAQIRHYWRAFVVIGLIGGCRRCTYAHVVTARRANSAPPKPRLWVTHLRQTEQRHRLPYWTP